ncbi:molybdopterin-dependent oxidoreductase [Hoyosella altamirensis]|uniref:Anaerobic selenocysteine-containing dehydrogenase n=1 Tax=Hoyosella altamirensis TaxID=616997 RepID=A0A839RJH1_9ACTN|nr:molybdopterin-dependent oxidoreductase [Hoyosella altamirensis]MBB3036378.1 anaerobic selenocysteine-containing dehydrogenase [Hoyosella altamirensis]
MQPKSTPKNDAPPPTTDASWQKTACILCECNCGLEVLVQDRALAKIRGDKEHPGSAGYTCEKPLRLDKYQSTPHRLTSPLRRQADGTYEEIDWETALDEIAAKLLEVKNRYGGDKVFFYGGGGQGNHLGGAYGRAMFHALGATYMSNALAQEKTGEGWVDQLLYGNHTSGDFENTEVAIFIGKNPWQSHGVARARPLLREIARDPQRAIIVIDPRKSETAELADIHLQLKPGTDAWCVAAIVATLVQEDLLDHTFLAERTTGIEDVLAALARIDIPGYARRCGVPEQQIRAAARRIAAAESAATYEDLGVQQSPNSTLVAYLNKMMWILTGNFAKPGGVHIHSWVFPVAGRWHPVPSTRSRPRVLRARRALGLTAMRWAAPALRRAFAASPGNTITGRLSAQVADTTLAAFFPAVAVPVARRIADVLSGSTAPETTPVTGARIISGLIPANSITEEILTDHPNRFRAMWIDSSNPAHSLAESERFRRAMRALELSVVVDVAFTETARQADYVLPAASQFEKHEASLFTLHFPHNTFQLRHPLMPPLPGTKPEPEIYAAIIDKLGAVDEGLISDLTAAARTSRSAFALAFFAAIEHEPRLAGLVPYLLYRSLGQVLPPGEQATALIWGLAHLCAIAQPDAVARAGFSASGFALGEQLFDAFTSRREGVVFAEDRYEDAWGYIQHADGKIHARIPELLDELALIDEIEPSYTSDEFPFTLSVGERRSFTANVIIRDPGWRRRDKHGALRMAPQDAKRLAIESGARVRVVTEAGAAETPVEVSEMMQPGHISLPNGLGVLYPNEDGEESQVGVSPNTLTTLTRRDKFWGTPWHKNVPARIEHLSHPAS